MNPGRSHSIPPKQMPTKTPPTRTNGPYDWPCIPPGSFHSDDWAGQLGGKRDAATLQPIGGTIYDCNPYGHTLRPYIPPQPNIPAIWTHWLGPDWTDPEISMRGWGRYPWLAIYNPQPTPTSGPVWYSGAQVTVAEGETYILSAEIAFPLGVIYATATLPTTPRTFPTELIVTNLDGGNWKCYGYLIPPTSSLAATSDAQAAQRARFAAATLAWQNLSPEEQQIYNATAKRKHLSGQNIFISKNAQA